jgi:dolichol-phosphate mannosyltransferase
MSQSPISIVIPLFNECEVFAALRSRLTALADDLAPRHAVEIVLVDDGSRDATWNLVTEWAAVDKRVRGLSFSRNFGHQAAITCGYDEAAGDAVICMDADLQDPPEVIPQMLEAWERGADIVVATRESREGESWFKLATASVFYRLLRLISDTDVEVDAGDFRLMSRRSIEAFRSMRERRRYLRGLVGWMGFRTEVVRYRRVARAAGKTKFTLLKMLRFAIDGIVSFSFAPLRLSFALAVIASAPVFAYLLYAVIAHIWFHARFEPGWASLVLIVTGFGFLNLLCLGVMGEYVGRLYEEVKGRPIYLVAKRAEESGDVR